MLIALYPENLWSVVFMETHETAAFYLVICDEDVVFTWIFTLQFEISSLCRYQTDNPGLDEFQTGTLFSTFGMKLSDLNSFI